ncbi:MAG: succinate dehydrogenase [Rhodospirillales bacterium]|nr:succinate dehydrogenase [Rhodospirillales bacterium]MSP80417.1 succinate dehydrogenase [Rhodospirillales bacterium]
MNNPRGETLLWLAQRASAAVLAICVVVHLGTMIHAVRGGLTAAEILGRVRGQAGWEMFYWVFVVAVAIHAPLGLRTIARELSGWRGPTLEAATALAAFLLALFGSRAVTGLVG